MDKRFVGLLLMIGIGSVALGSIIFARWGGAEYTILTNDYPKDPFGRGYMPLTEETDRFLMSILVSRPLEEVSLDFAYLVNTTYEAPEQPPQRWNHMDLTVRAAQIGPIPRILNRSGEFGGLQWSTRTYKLEWNDRKYALVLFDFSNITFWAGRNASAVDSLQGVLFDEDGKVAGYFPGRRVFLGYPEALQRLYIERSGKRVEYAAVSKGVQPPGTLPLSQTPAFGRVNFTEVRKDEIVSVGFEVNPARLSPTEYVYLTYLAVNGEQRETFAYLIRRESS